MNTFLLIVAGVMLTAAVVMAFIPQSWSAPLAWLGLLLARLSGHLMLSTGQVIFWAVAAAIVLGINYLLPVAVVKSRRGVPYIAGGALVGAFVGMIASGAMLIVGSVVGATFGALAYKRTPAGADLEFPSRRFFNYLAAKGLPAVVTLCIVGIALGLIVTQYTLLSTLNP